MATNIDEQSLAIGISLVTNIIKESVNKPTEDLRNEIVANLSAWFTTNQIIELITTAADKLGMVDYRDVDDIISQWQNTAALAVDYVEHASIWQTIAQALLFTARELSGLLPVPWRQIVIAMLDAYDQIKK